MNISEPEAKPGKFISHIVFGVDLQTIANDYLGELVLSAYLEQKMDRCAKVLATKGKPPFFDSRL